MYKISSFSLPSYSIIKYAQRSMDEKTKNMIATDDLQYHSVDIKNNPRPESHLMDSQGVVFFHS